MYLLYLLVGMVVVGMYLGMYLGTCMDVRFFCFLHCIQLVKCKILISDPDCFAELCKEKQESPVYLGDTGELFGNQLWSAAALEATILHQADCL